jgi:hypothetical protein
VLRAAPQPLRLCTDFLSLRDRLQRRTARHGTARACARSSALGWEVRADRCARRVRLPSVSSAPSSTARTAHGTRRAASIGRSPLGRCRRLRGRCFFGALGRSTNSAARPPLPLGRAALVEGPPAVRAYPLRGQGHTALCRVRRPLMQRRCVSQVLREGYTGITAAVVACDGPWAPVDVAARKRASVEAIANQG